MLRPMVEAYRSYVVRVRRRAVAGDTVQIDVEDLIGGGRVAMHGDEARSLADRLQLLLVEGVAPTADTDVVRGASQPEAGPSDP